MAIAPTIFTEIQVSDPVFIKDKYTVKDNGNQQAQLQAQLITAERKMHFPSKSP
jgi:hypothetical protein